MNFEVFWPWVLRESETEVLRSLHDSSGALICGEAGTGKSSLVSRVSAVGEFSAGRKVRWVGVSGSWAMREIPLAVLDSLLSPLSVAAKSSVFELAAALNVDLRREDDEIVVLAVDDAHLLDEASEQLLTQVVELGGIKLLASTRPVGLRPVPFGTLWKRDYIKRVDLGSIEQGIVAEVLKGTLGSTVDIDLIRHADRLSAGNLLALSEYVRVGQATGMFVRKDGVWCLAGVLKSDQRLGDLIALQLADLDARETETVEFIATAEPVSLAEVLRRSSPETIEKLLGIGLITASSPQQDDPVPVTVSMRHPLFAETLRQRMSPTRRMANLGYLLDAHQISEQSAPRDIMRWVGWSTEAGRSVPVALALSAAGTALNVGQSEFALRVLQATGDELVEVGMDIEGDLLRSKALRMSGRMNEARSLLDETVEKVERRELTEHNVDRFLEVHEARADLEQSYLGNSERAAVLLDDAYGRVKQAIPHELVALRCDLIGAAFRGWAGDLGPARRLAPLLPELTDFPPAVYAAAPVMMALLSHGRFEEAYRLGELYAPVARHWAEYDALPQQSLTMVRAFLRIAAGATRVLSENLAQDQWSSDVFLHLEPTIVYLAEARTHIYSGDWAVGDELLTRARAMCDARDLTALRPMIVASEALSAVLVGDRLRAQTLCRQFETLPPMHPHCFAFDAETSIVRALVGLGAPEAVDRARRMLVDAREHQHPFVELLASHLMALADTAAARSEGVDDRLDVLADNVDVPVAAPMIEHTRALLAGDEPREVLALRKLNDMGVWLPLLPAAVELTKREQEIALLAASGLTSAAIGEQLVISRRTVESHLNRIFVKLNINSRSELARVGLK